MDVILTALSAITGYLLGSLNSSLLVGRLYGKDVREHGSGNAGMTNTLRVLGRTAALMTAAGDILKGVLACLAGLALTGDAGAVIAGAAAVAGHNWPLYFKFRGGKGALTSISVVYFLDWKTGLIITGVFLAVVLLTRYVSLGSMTGAAMLPVLALLFGKSALFLGFSILIAVLVIARHRSNIERLLKGQESSLGEKKSRE